jgi:hypothetical protein
LVGWLVDAREYIRITREIGLFFDKDLMIHCGRINGGSMEEIGNGLFSRNYLDRALKLHLEDSGRNTSTILFVK